MSTTSPPPPDDSQDQPLDDPDEFKAWTAAQSSNPNHMGLKGVTIKNGPRVCKTASLATYGNPDTGEIRKRHLKLVKTGRQGGRFNFDNPDLVLSFENAEIARLASFLAGEIASPGRYRVVSASSPISEFIELLRERPDDLAALVDGLNAASDATALAAALASSASGISSAEAAVILDRRDLLSRAGALARSSGVTETQMQRLIGDSWWIFGGQYVGVLPRRQILQLDEHDIPLICADNSLHIVELKGPSVPALIKRHRNHWIVGTEVHEAVMQAVNYVRSADELGASAQRNLRDELGLDVDLRRVFGTVVIGHREHVAMRLPDGQLETTLRTYNASLNRVQVVTYDQLISRAERSLNFTGSDDRPRGLQ